MPRFLWCLIVVVLGAVPVFAAGVPQSIAGSWRVIGVIPTSNVQAEADKTLIGKIFSYGDYEANLGGKVIAAPLYTTKRTNAYDLDSGFRADITRELKLPRQGVSVIELSIMRPISPI